MKLYGKATDVGAQIVERFKNPAGLPVPLARVFIHRKDASPCRSWSWSNQLIVAIHGYSEARGYRQWEAVGRQVIKGQKAIYILAPCVKKLETAGDDGETKEASALYGFRSVPVFGLEQTDGSRYRSTNGLSPGWKACRFAKWRSRGESKSRASTAARAVASAITRRPARSHSESRTSRRGVTSCATPQMPATSAA